MQQLIDTLSKMDKAEICYKTGLSMSTVLNILSGRNDNPGIKTIEKLKNFVKEKENELSSNG